MTISQWFNAEAGCAQRGALGDLIKAFHGVAGQRPCLRADSDSILAFAWLCASTVLACAAVRENVAGEAHNGHHRPMPVASNAPPRERSIPEVTDAMVRAGVEALQSAPQMSAEALVTRIYEAMAREIAMLPIFDMEAR